MSSQKKPSFWQRLKYLLTAEEYTINSPVDNDQPQPLQQKREIDNFNKSQRQQPGSGENLKPSTDSAQSTTHGTEKKKSESASEAASVKLISWANLDEADNMQLRTTSVQNSENPITDSILDFLEASDLSYYYHEPTAESDFNDPEQDPADVPSGNQTQKYQGSISKRNVHHISMAMRYYQEGAANDTTDTDADSSVDTQSAIEKGEVEWGCVIRVHEHTQLVAFYGVLPFQLPESHLQAGMTLATQLNYDMMLGCVEIDIRDGEIRFKNSLDLEPIINANGGSVPPTVISYLLKGVMAMTASFAPLFSDLLASDPQDFELDSLLDQLNQAQMDRTFFLATRMVQ
ncbi:hypothetical protein [Psychrobacter phenylpyruvicus]|uniref:Family of uncharacterized function (DUF1790) n=1 Tax=Psychrobacter phenylpyruvicus TaxID=29432 RepID=A0A379LJ11_9GAMM|nr:hypothetical protein [Psychrobacter phenylpyruvicus]SUD89774.1 Family of uncharacterised function (DUF1790) [Psychrobacter phenylpyruvicus]